MTAVDYAASEAVRKQRPASVPELPKEMMSEDRKARVCFQSQKEKKRMHKHAHKRPSRTALGVACRFFKWHTSKAGPLLAVLIRFRFLCVLPVVMTAGVSSAT